jgi:hypothetical protein
MNPSGERGKADLRSEAPTWRPVEVSLARTILLVVLATSAFAILLPWLDKLPPEALSSMCGHNACLPVALPVLAHPKSADLQGPSKAEPR